VAVIKTIAKQARRKQDSEADDDWDQQAQYWMEQAGLQHGHAKALVRLGNAALEEAKRKDDAAVQRHVERAMQYYEMAGERGSAEGWFNLGHLLWTGYPNIEEQGDESSHTTIIDQDKKESIKAFFKAIDLGDPDAMFFVGVQLLSDDVDDIGIEHETTKERCQAGLELIERAAALEHGGALYYLSLLHLNGHEESNISPCEPEEFVSRLEAAAAAGDADALFLQGHCYYHGDDGHEQSFVKALDSFLAAADMGHSDAAVSAGAMLHRGVGGGVDMDRRRAFELYQMAGELGNVEGWRNVVACYALGEGVPQCQQTAEYIAKTMLRDD
jgi:TPR repeat protein